MDSEAPLQAVFNIEFFRALESVSCFVYRTDSGRNKGSDIFSQMTVTKKKPLPIDVGKMIGVDGSSLCFLLSRLAVMQRDPALAGNGFGQLVEHLEVHLGKSTRAKGNRITPV